MTLRPPQSTLFPYTTLFRSGKPPTADELVELAFKRFRFCRTPEVEPFAVERAGPSIAQMIRTGADPFFDTLIRRARDRKSTCLISSHGYMSYAVFCLKKKKN